MKRYVQTFEQYAVNEGLMDTIVNAAYGVSNKVTNALGRMANRQPEVEEVEPEMETDFDNDIEIEDDFETEVAPAKTRSISQNYRDEIDRREASGERVHPDYEDMYNSYRANGY